MPQPASIDFTDQSLEESVKKLSEYLSQGGIVADRIGMPESQRNSLYQLGRGMYEGGRYRDAFKVFSLLLAEDHFEPRYLMGLGGAAQMLKRYPDALLQYAAATLIKVDDPTPLFHGGECLVAMGHLPEAGESLELALELCREQHAALRLRIEALLHSIEINTK